MDEKSFNASRPILTSDSERKAGCKQSITSPVTLQTIKKIILPRLKGKEMFGAKERTFPNDK